MEDFTRATQALSDETRLRIINLLTAHECCVCEIMQALQISQTRASRNLKLLRDTNFLCQRHEGLYTLYSIKSFSSDDFRTDLLHAAKKMLMEFPIARKDMARLSKAKRIGVGLHCN